MKKIILFLSLLSFLGTVARGTESVIEIRGSDAKELAELLMYQGTIPLEYHGVTIVKTVDGDVLQTKKFNCYNKKLSATLTFWGCEFVDVVNGKEFLLADYPAWQLFEILKNAGIPERKYGNNNNTSASANFLECNLNNGMCLASISN